MTDLLADKKASRSAKLAGVSSAIAVAIILLALILHFTLRPHWMTIFIVLFIAQRVYESYFLAGHSASTFAGQDVHLRQVVKAYTIMVLASVLEFYLGKKPLQWGWAGAGFAVLAISLFLRWAAIGAIGEGWTIDTWRVPSRIQRVGPYRLLRHPYYVGVFLESVAFPMILNSWLGILLSLLVVAPLEGRRAILEERNLVNQFGWD